MLEVLWRHGPSTVRKVHIELSNRKAVGYTTALKLLQVMVEKCLVSRVRVGRAHIYEAQVPMEITRRRMVRDFIDRVFGGSTSALVLGLLSEDDISPEERDEVSRLLESKASRIE